MKQDRDAEAKEVLIHESNVLCPYNKEVGGSPRNCSPATWCNQRGGEAAPTAAPFAFSPTALVTRREETKSVGGTARNPMVKNFTSSLNEINNDFLS